MDIFFTSDHHFNHANILTFVDGDNSHIRPGFDSVDEMDEFMIEQWNSVVKDGDRVYHLGDVAMNAKVLSNIIPKLKGSKRLCLGNHDEDILALKACFKKIRLWRIFKEEGFICSHIPLRLEQFRHKTALNVHGHLHRNIIQDSRYFNVCVENHEYKPVHMDEVLERVKKAREEYPLEESVDSVG